MSERKPQSPKIENIVASGSIADSIDLEMLTSKLKNYDLNKKRFPGAVLRLPDPKIAGTHIFFGKGRNNRRKKPKGFSPWAGYSHTKNERGGSDLL